MFQKIKKRIELALLIIVVKKLIFYLMKQSSNKKRDTKNSQSYQRLGIQYLLSSDRSQHKSMIYDKIGARIIQKSQSKNNKFLIELPKIYPIHKKLMSMKMKDIDMHKYHHDRRFHLRGFRFLLDMEHSQDTTIETEELQKSRISIKKKQSSMVGSGSGGVWNDLVLKVNGIGAFVPLKNVKLKAFVEEGNNSRLIKELLRKRANIKLVESKTQADIVWTRFSDYIAIQKISKYQQKIQKSQSSFSRTQQDYIEAIKRLTQIQHEKILHTQDQKSIQMTSLFMHNHLKNHQQISDKKNLFKNIRAYCKANGIDEGSIIPKTFHFECARMKDQQQLNTRVEEIYLDKQFSESSFFIVKPGEDTNRGELITVVKGKQSIISAIRQLQKYNKSSLIQQYINPLLYRSRKFDIRCYVLVTSVAGQLHAYWYKQGYLRTCVKEFSYDPSNLFGHLTNDAVQKKHKDYGKFQQANKLSFNDLESILAQTQKTRQDVIREMKSLAMHSIKAVENKLRGDRNVFGFEIFGYDFLIDNNGKVWLIEVNTNPCLEFSGSLLSRIIWHMVDNSIRIAIDPILDPDARKEYHSYLDINKYQLIV